LIIQEEPYTIDVDLPSTSALPVVSNNNITFTAVPQQTNDELTVASFNLERFFDNVNDPLIGEPILTAAAYANRLNKASLGNKKCSSFSGCDWY
jgi:hypothetical protein